MPEIRLEEVVELFFFGLAFAALGRMISVALRDVLRRTGRFPWLAPGLALASDSAALMALVALLICTVIRIGLGGPHRGEAAIDLLLLVFVALAVGWLARRDYRTLVASTKQT